MTDERVGDTQQPADQPDVQVSDVQEALDADIPRAAMAVSRALSKRGVRAGEKES